MLLDFLFRSIYEEKNARKRNEENQNRRNRIKTNGRPIVCFDIMELLIKPKWSFKKMDFIYLKRKHTEEWLFSMSRRFHLVVISNIYPPEGNYIIRKIDPYCSIRSYFFVNNKKEIDWNLFPKKENTVFLSNSQKKYKECFSRNILEIPKWNGRKDDYLLDILHMFNNIYYSKQKDYQNIIEMYKNKNVFSVFKNVQKRLYNERNIFKRKAFEEKLEEINKKIIEEYANTRSRVSTYQQTETVFEFWKKVLKEVFL